jgi:predicted nucleic acid-binding protein
MMRILLDTVTVSELRPSDDKMCPKVLAWQKTIRESSLSVITLNELRYGIKKVESRDPVFAVHLAAWYAKIITQPRFFRILNVDRSIAELAADFRVTHNTPFEDALIAATAEIHGLTLATRNTGDFKDCGIAVVNPWDYRSSQR